MTLRKRTLALLIAAALTPQFAATAYAQAPGYAPPGYAPPPAQAPARVYSQAELDQMLAPIALYPDALLSQVLMAATYPVEVVEAARWTRANPGLRGDAAVRAVQNQDWDPSVQSLCAFPHILQRMEEHLQWTENLGDAFLAQEAAVMDSVQELRHRAYASGHLRSTEHIHVVQQGPVIYVRPARLDLFYVPYYDPLYVYGDWRWPAYRPVAWAPWPGYVRPAPGLSVGFWFGSPVSLSANFFYGDFDWGRRSVRVVRPTAYYYRPPRVVVNNTYVNRSAAVDRSSWQHDPHHRRGHEYRQAEVRQRFATTQVERGQERRGGQREAREPTPRQALAPQPQREVQQPQARPEQIRPERREAREEQQRQRSDSRAAERAQQQQQREQAQAAERSQRQQRDQAQSAERAQRDQQRQQAEAARAQQQQQRQQAETSRAQQQQQRQQAREERRDTREARKDERGERGERGGGKGGERS